ncbi:nucleoside triphosphate pyrophosphohydrolase [Psychrobacillus vulpis]|uniref:Phosphoribosyl-ATP pyrophosphohydrolase n=1 Tax=Psychrobacillus vulpis TaxID=2325572 RepID=A0A544TVE6_9BACI|nr:nucleoside triphosphate pyrophosphohydrolase [Psychrobacillus vulpis]TQR21422.1 phosphoribosyl-ATP pyrophosphohydrolase [Psychrobacillus vulpis]
MPVYNKLVRDLIPQVIEKSGSHFSSRILDKSEHLTEIKKKLFEEVQEFTETTNRHDALEELADILELLHAALPVHKATFEELEKIRIAKKEKRGGFEEGIYLIEDEDN